jgi:hypothetical protein
MREASRVKVTSICQPSRNTKGEASSFSRQEIAKLHDPEVLKRTYITKNKEIANFLDQEVLNHPFFVYFPFGAITSGADGKIYFEQNKLTI